MKIRYARAATTALVVGVVTLLLFLAAVFVFLRLALGHHAGNQERRSQVRALLHRVYGAREVCFKSTHGVTLVGLLIQPKKPRGTVVLCHGYRHSKELMGRYCALFKDYNMLLFDFRGAGQSGGFFSSIGYYESEDVKAAISFVREAVSGPGCRPLLLFGVSMGASAVLKAAAECSDGIDGLILDSPYASLAAVIEQSMQHFSFMPRWLLGGAAWVVQTILGPILTMNPRKYIKQLHVPALFIHASSDGITSPAHSVCLFRRMLKYRRAPAYLWLTPPAKHAYSYVSYPVHYSEQINRFLNNSVRIKK